ncbi:MAG: hypothetical protein AAGA87_15535 [Pseudomonadota bacterium]
MSDVIKMAQTKRAKKLAQIEDLMAEVEELDDFISFGNALTEEGSSSDSEPTAEDKSDDKSAEIAAE